MIQGWGMTETSPVCAFGRAPKGVAPEQEMDWRAKTGRIIAGVELRVVDEDGRGAAQRRHSRWASSRCGARGSPARTTATPPPSASTTGGCAPATSGASTTGGSCRSRTAPRTSSSPGGEWISSVELENEVMAHPDVVEAAVIGVPDERWDERPLVVVVAAEGAHPQPDEILTFLSGRVARWWLPERWAFVDEIPKTSVGKFDKKVLRAKAADGALEIYEVEPPRARDALRTGGRGSRRRRRPARSHRRGARRPGLRPAARGRRAGRAAAATPDPPWWPRRNASPGRAARWRRRWCVLRRAPASAATTTAATPWSTSVDELVQGVDQLPEPPVVDPVEAQRHPGQLDVVAARSARARAAWWAGWTRSPRCRRSAR